MPRKTRKQKERAMSHRVAQTSNSGVVKREFTFSFDQATNMNLARQQAKSSDLSRQTLDVRFASRDLVKTLVLALGVFVLELVVYFAWFKTSNVF